MCPWHGACFAAETGDIEDGICKTANILAISNYNNQGPSIDALNSFHVQIKGDRLFVKVNEKGLIDITCFPLFYMVLF